MYAVLVDFIIKKKKIEAFSKAVLTQAQNSLEKESECHCFDVCRDPERENAFFLYELYTDRKAFDTHLASSHFLAFDKQVSEYVMEKSVRFLQKIAE